MNAKFEGLIKNMKVGMDKHSPEILTGIGISCGVTAIVLGVKATPKALMLIEDAQYEKGDTLTTVEKVKATWKCYVPAAISEAVSISCLIGASSVNARRNAALATAYKISQTALTEYKDKVIETIGEKKEQTIKDKIAQDRVDKRDIHSNDVVLMGTGTTLCCDVVMNREFWSDYETIRAAVNNINEKLLSYDYVSLNEFYDELNIDHSEIGDRIGWNISRDGQLQVSYSSVLTKDGKPALALSYDVEPRYDYSKFS